MRRALVAGRGRYLWSWWRSPCPAGGSPTYGVGGGLLALLVEAEVSGHRSVRCLSLHRLTVRADQNTGHHAQRAKPWNKQNHCNKERTKKENI